MDKVKNTKLALWQERLADSNRAYSAEVSRMDRRERLYAGNNDIRPLVPGDERRDGGWKKTSHVRNIVFENIESQVSTDIPMPKVTAMRREDEPKAELIERFLRNEIDRLPFERINDMAERTVPMQGGVGYFVDWDNTVSTHTTLGAVDVRLIHPKEFAPQPGIYTGIEDMDWFILKIPTTKEAVRRRYGVSVDDESEAEPDVRSVDADTAEDSVTQYIGYARNDSGGIDRYTWVNDVELEDLENYQARHQPTCKRCGHVKPLMGQVIYNTVTDTLAGQTAPAGLGESELAGQLLAMELAGAAMEGVPALEALPVAGREPDGRKTEPERYDGGPCPYCGGEEWESREQEYEEIPVPITNRFGLEVPGMTPGFDEDGYPAMITTKIPFYTPNKYPIVLQRSVSVYGQLLGNSDADMIADQQNTINRLSQKIIDRLIKAGTRITLPDKANLRTDPEDSERWYLESAADKSMIGVYDFSGNLEYELTYLSEAYEESRQILGITDSFQGRRDTTATSGKAKEFSAAQAAGRLESKRVMKNAAYADLYEMMFKFWLAYSDEPRPVVYRDQNGDTQYDEFSRYDFLERDSAGEYYWNDNFLFSCDTSAQLANNREAMWQETRQNFQSGAFGDPTRTETLLLFWEKMEQLHYPMAGDTKAYLQERLEQERQMMMQQQMMQQQMMQQAQMQQMPAGETGGIPPDVTGQVIQQARADAETDAANQYM